MTKTKREYAGSHIIAEFWEGKIVESPKEMKRILVTAAKKSNHVSLGTKIHKFQPRGLTGFILLAESHISIHTWPELDYIAIDIFSCGKRSRPQQALNYLKQVFKPKTAKIQELKRGA